jgi:hypothetical protein
MVHFGKDLLTNQVPGWEEYVFFLRFFFVSFSGESGNHSTREFCKVQKDMEITGMETYCISQS